MARSVLPTSRVIRVSPHARYAFIGTLLAGALLLVAGCGGRTGAANWKILFPAEHDADWGMYVVGRGGGRPVRIAAATAPIYSPEVPSPDGRRLILPRFPPEAIVVLTLDGGGRSEEHTSELQSRGELVCRPLPEK